MSLVIDGKSVKIEQPNISDVNVLMQNHSGKFFELIGEQLRLIVPNWDDFKDTISIQDSIYIMAFYRATVWHDIPIAIDDKQGLEVKPSEVIKKKYSDEKETFLIKGKRFSNAIPLKNAIEAEQLAVSRNDFAKFGDYILGAGIKDNEVILGVDTMINLKSNPVGRGVYHSYMQSATDYSPVELMLNVDNNRPIGIFINDKEFPFRASLLCSI